MAGGVIPHHYSHGFAPWPQPDEIARRGGRRLLFFPTWTGKNVRKTGPVISRTRFLISAL